MAATDSGQQGGNLIFAYNNNCKGQPSQESVWSAARFSWLANTMNLNPKESWRSVSIERVYVCVRAELLVCVLPFFVCLSVGSIKFRGRLHCLYAYTEHRMPAFCRFLFGLLCMLSSLVRLYFLISFRLHSMRVEMATFGFVCAF